VGFTTLEVSGINSSIKWMRNPTESEGDNFGESDKKLAKTLSSAKAGSGHDCFLKGIIVHVEIEATHDSILQWYRYHFRDTVSSTSKMYTLLKQDVKSKCSPYVYQGTIDLINDLISLYDKCETDEEVRARFNSSKFLYDWINKTPTNKKELFECIVHNVPLGYKLKMGEVTNYLQLKTMYNQRKNHKMSFWNTEFVNWIKSLPHSWLITG